jgi:hypothetical protein
LHRARRSDDQPLMITLPPPPPPPPELDPPLGALGVVGAGVLGTGALWVEGLGVEVDGALVLGVVATGFGFGFGLALSAGSAVLAGGAATAGAVTGETCSVVGIAELDDDALGAATFPIASAAANSAANRTTSSPRRAGEGWVSDIWSSAFSSRAPCSA